MKKTELKDKLKPIIKECINEVLLESGMISSIISEALKGVRESGLLTEMQQNQARTPLPSAPSRQRQQPRQKDSLELQLERQEQARQEHIKKLNEASKDWFGGVNVFEEVEEIPKETEQETIRESLGDKDIVVPKAANPLAGRAPNDPGINISGLVRLAGNKWKV